MTDGVNITKVVRFIVSELCVNVEFCPMFLATTLEGHKKALSVPRLASF